MRDLGGRDPSHCNGKFIGFNWERNLRAGLLMLYVNPHQELMDFSPEEGEEEEDTESIDESIRRAGQLFSSPSKTSKVSFR